MRVASSGFHDAYHRSMVRSGRPVATASRAVRSLARMAGETRATTPSSHHGGAAPSLPPGGRGCE